MKTIKLMSQQVEKPKPLLQTTWFDGRKIILLRTDGEKDFYGVRDETGDVVSRVELRSSTTNNRDAARRQESVNALVEVIDAKGDTDGTV
jgi:hypothetical protein